MLPADASGLPGLVETSSSKHSLAPEISSEVVSLIQMLLMAQLQFWVLMSGYRTRLSRDPRGLLFSVSL